MKEKEWIVVSENWTISSTDNGENSWKAWSKETLSNFSTKEISRFKDFARKPWPPIKIMEYEFDIIAVNGREVVIVEVKTTLRLRDLDHFTEKLKMFKKVWPEYRDKKIYGAVAYLKAMREQTRGHRKRGFL